MLAVFGPMLGGDEAVGRSTTENRQGSQHSDQAKGYGFHDGFLPLIGGVVGIDVFEHLGRLAIGRLAIGTVIADPHEVVIQLLAVVGISHGFTGFFENVHHGFVSLEVLRNQQLGRRARSKQQQCRQGEYDDREFSHSFHLLSSLLVTVADAVEVGIAIAGHLADDFAVGFDTRPELMRGLKYKNLIVLIHGLDRQYVLAWMSREFHRHATAQATGHQGGDEKRHNGEYDQFFTHFNPLILEFKRFVFAIRQRTVFADVANEQTDILAAVRVDQLHGVVFGIDGRDDLRLTTTEKRQDTDCAKETAPSPF